MKRTFRALDTVVELMYDDALVGRSLIELMVSGYPTTTAPATLAYELHDDRIARVGYVRDVVDPIDIAPMLELDLYHEVVARAAPGWILHAAALEVGDRTIVLAGPSGAGKTTLTLALAAIGAQILTEEIVRIDRDLSVHALARPIHLETVADVPEGWRHHVYQLRRDTGIAERVIARPPAYVTEPRRLGALIRIEHGADLVPSLGPLASPIAPLWDATLRQDDDGLATATDVVGRVRPQLLRSCSIDSALALLTS